VQHRHGLRERPHEVHVVLDDDDGAFLGDALQQPPGLVLLLGAHPGHRLVQHEQLRVLHQQHADLEPLLLAVRQDAGGDVDEVGEADRLQRRGHLVGHPGPAAQQRQRTAAATGGDVEVLQHRQLLEHRRGLERAADAEPGDPVHLPPHQLMPAEAGRTGRPHQPGHGVDQSGLARAVRADEEAQVAGSTDRFTESTATNPSKETVRSVSSR
jgi:hypothetical protein